MMVCYLVPKPGPKTWSRAICVPPHKIKAILHQSAVQNIALMYLVSEQKKDKEKFFNKIGKFSVGVDIANSNGPTFTQLKKKQTYHGSSRCQDSLSLCISIVCIPSVCIFSVCIFNPSPMSAKRAGQPGIQQRCLTLLNPMLQSLCR